jgi:hypothetical protein
LPRRARHPPASRQLHEAWSTHLDAYAQIEAADAQVAFVDSTERLPAHDTDMRCSRKPDVRAWIEAHGEDADRSTRGGRCTG